jgi:hypothetical protein
VPRGFSPYNRGATADVTRQGRRQAVRPAVARQEGVMLPGDSRRRSRLTVGWASEVIRTEE